MTETVGATRWYVHRRGSGWHWVTPMDAARYAITRPRDPGLVRLGRPEATRAEPVHEPRIMAFFPKVPAGERPGGTEGAPLCRVCHAVCPPRRRCYCSDECSDRYAEFHVWSQIRLRVDNRDRGVCSECGVDTEAAQAWWRRIRERIRHSRHDFRGLLRAMRAAGWPGFGRDWWEADHIVARKDGGRDRLDNLRTLCVPCHKERTKKQHQEWAKRRRDRQASLFHGTEATA